MRHLRLLQQVSEIARAGSIRQAAERMNITASAMNRRIQDLELEIGEPIFERRARGVRLTAAGEMFLRYARAQIAEAEQFTSQVEDLRGLRRGPVSIACSQAVAYDFLPTQIAAFRTEHPRLVFEVKVMDGLAALAALADYETDLALVYRPAVRPNIRVITVLRQRLVALMRADHPLAEKTALRLSDCVQFPLALPDPSLAGRQLLDEIAGRRDLRFDVMAESNSFEMLRGIVRRSELISFQAEIGAPNPELDPGIVSRPIDTRDVPVSDLALCQLRGRNLPVASAAFAERLARSVSG